MNIKEEYVSSFATQTACGQLAEHIVKLTSKFLEIQNHLSDKELLDFKLKCLNFCFECLEYYNECAIAFGTKINCLEFGINNPCEISIDSSSLIESVHKMDVVFHNLTKQFDLEKILFLDFILEDELTNENIKNLEQKNEYLRGCIIAFEREINS